MSLYIPVYKKIKYSENVILERSLPAKGEIIVKPGDKVVPFSKIGRAKVSDTAFVLDNKIKLPTGKSEEGSFFYKGEKIGHVGFKKIISPYNGYLSYEDGIIRFNQEKKDVWLLSGVWGYIKEIEGNVNAKIETQTVDINFVAYSNKRLMGEFIVFPNPSELLDLEYLENFSNNIKDKIIYVGHHIRKEVYEKALDLGVAGLVAGSIDRLLYERTKASPIAVAITTGFGTLTTPFHIFEFFKTISNRHVFLDGEKGLLEVPVPFDNAFVATDESSSLRVVEKGLSVLIFDRMHFGLTGVVHEVQNEIIYVKLNKSSEIVETKVPNIFALI